jgi:2-hydroxy-6-oxonona-2,4-dienedioate hydrolase
VDEPFGRLRGVWRVVDGLRMFARVATRPLPAELPPVVMVHGLAMSSWYLQPLAQRLAPISRVYVPDLPGFGRSEKPPHVLTIAEMSDTLVGWMRAVGLERAVILGHSLGCQVAARFAARYPEMTQGAILVSPTMDPDISWPTFLLRGLCDLAYEPDVIVRLMAYGSVHATPWRILRTLQHALDDQCETIYPAIQAPTLVVRGERDPVSSQRWAERVASMSPQRRPLRLLPGRTHSVNVNAPRALLGALLPFLREIATEERRTNSCAIVRHTTTETRETIPATLVASAMREALQMR